MGILRLMIKYLPCPWARRSGRDAAGRLNALYPRVSRSASIARPTRSAGDAANRAQWRHRHGAAARNIGRRLTQGLVPRRGEGTYKSCERGGARWSATWNAGADDGTPLRGMPERTMRTLSDQVVLACHAESGAGPPGGCADPRRSEIGAGAPSGSQQEPRRSAFRPGADAARRHARRPLWASWNYPEPTGSPAPRARVVRHILDETSLHKKLRPRDGSTSIRGSLKASPRSGDPGLTPPPQSFIDSDNKRDRSAEYQGARRCRQPPSRRTPTSRAAAAHLILAGRLGWELL